MPASLALWCDACGVSCAGHDVSCPMCGDTMVYEWVDDDD